MSIFNKEKQERIAVDIPPELKRMAKTEAARTNKTLKEVLETLIQKWLAGEIKIDQPK